jgi:hypothetical protein
MKFPYGISDFGKIIDDGLFYQDRTHLIPLLEEAGYQLLFLRPRRFGKSLLLSLLEHYYDVKRADQFQTLFGGLAIGQNPTPLHNRYFIMHWDFSLVKAQGEVREIERALHQIINMCVARCASIYDLPVTIHEDNAVYSFNALLTAIQNTGHKLYLFIDEYDNFANEVLMAKKEHYEKLLYGEGLFKTVFKAVKGAAGHGLDRVFITGVSPVAMADLTSGYNVAKNIYLNPEFNALCGFTEAEISTLLQAIHAESNTWSVDSVLALMRTFYNGYRFSEESEQSVYNPTLSLYFIETLHQRGHYPREMLDNNLAMDRSKLGYIAELLQDDQVLLEALDTETGVSIPRLANRFGITDLFRGLEGRRVMASLLYYFGILTLAGETAFGETLLKIPNLVSRSLYIERIQDWLSLPASDREHALKVARSLCQHGEMQPLCEFIEQRLFPVLSTRDYRWSNELAVKILFMTVLFNDHIYMMVSETEVDHGFIDLSLIVRPDMRRFQALDLVLEFKYVGLKDLGLTGLELKARSQAELLALPKVAIKREEAKDQAKRYAEVLKTRYGLTTITGFAIVALGLERIVYEEVRA